jgi:hypothetical protein
MRKLIIGLLAVTGAAAIAYRFAVLPWFRTWGVNPEITSRALPGDEVIPDAMAGETRTITIEAPPADVWPWLLQMGFGRAGWYSYDAMDMSGSSAAEIMPQFQTLAVGDVVPTHPGGGFVVRRLDPGQALVLYLDSDLVRQQAETAAADPSLEMPANLKATGALMENSQPTEFEASWAFVLEELPEGQTRLIERFRVRFGETDKPWTRYTLPMMGFGLFVMMRKQMLGIKQRAEGSQQALVAVGTVEPGPGTNAPAAPDEAATLER